MTPMWFKLKALFSHSRTIFAARMTQAAGVIVMVHDGIGVALVGQDFTPITARLMDALHVPQDLRPMVWGSIVIGVGEIFKWLRTHTFQSVEANKIDAQTAAEDAKDGVPSPPAPPETLQP